MAFTYDLTTDVGRVRFLIPDRDEHNAFFQDNEIEYALTLEGSVKRAAAQCLETQASDEAYVQKQIKLLDLSTNGPAVAKELRERAAGLRAQADIDDLNDGSAFDFAEMNVSDFAEREIVRNRYLRNGS